MDNYRKKAENTLFYKKLMETSIQNKEIIIYNSKVYIDDIHFKYDKNISYEKNYEYLINQSKSNDLKLLDFLSKRNKFD